MPYDNTNSGMMYRNDSDHEKAPEFTGFINVEGVEYWLSGWVNETKEGTKLAEKGIEKYFSIKLKPKEQKKPAPKPEEKRRPSGFEDMDDDIPF